MDSSDEIFIKLVFFLRWAVNDEIESTRLVPRLSRIQLVCIITIWSVCMLAVGLMVYDFWQQLLLQETLLKPLDLLLNPTGEDCLEDEKEE